jgi:hypothetical protein
MRLNVFMSATALLIIVAALCFWPKDQAKQTANSIVFMTESGGQLAYVFDKSTPGGLRQFDVNMVAYLKAGRKKASGDCGTKLSKISKLLFPTVQAASCSQGSCGGSYMHPYSLPCSAEGCQGYFIQFYSNPMEAMPQDGWKYDGGETCPPYDGSSGGCQCRQNFCS